MATNGKKNHIISIMVANKPGVLVRVAQVFARRGFNIDSLVVSPAMDGKFSRMTIAAEGNEYDLEQIVKQTSKLIDVLHATEHLGSHIVDQELALIKVRLKEKDRANLLQSLDHFNAITLDFADDAMIIQVSGTTERLNTFISMLHKYNIVEIVRSGKLLMARGKEPT